MAAPPILEPRHRSVPAPAAVPFDFRRADVLSTDQVRAVQSLYSGFARSVAAALSGYLRTYVSVTLEGIEQISFEAFSRNAGSAATILPLNMRPLENTAILGISHAALFPLVEILLGGPGKPIALMDRELTEIEKSLLEPLVRIMLQEMKSAWQPLVALEFAMDSTGSRPTGSALPKNEALIAAKFDLRLPEAAGAVHIALPSRGVRELMPRCSMPTPSGCGDDRSPMLRVLAGAELDLSVSLNGPRMLFRDLLQLEAGDVIAFDHPLGQELDLELNGIPKFKGHVVARGTRRVFQIKRELPPRSA